MPGPIKLKTVLLDAHANGNKQIFRHFARCLSPVMQYDYTLLNHRLNTLKSNDTACIGNGIQIFHGWVDDWAHPTVSFIRLKTPYDAHHAPDREPVDTILLVLSPKSAGATHLNLVSQLTRFVMDTHNIDMIRGADSVDAIRAIFENQESKTKRAA